MEMVTHGTTSRYPKSPFADVQKWVKLSAPPFKVGMDLRMKKKGSDFCPMKKQKKVVNALGLKSQDDWKRWSYCTERPPEIPSNPWVTYKDAGWNGICGLVRMKEKTPAFLQVGIKKERKGQHFCPMKKQKRWSMR